MITWLLKKASHFRKVEKQNSPLMDNKFRTPRLWSNRELRKFAHIFKGSIVNVSGWIDADKEGRHYRDYFSNATEYVITNYAADRDRGAQGVAGEITLDLEKGLPSGLINRFDIAFNHTVLEHVFDIRKAFSDICLIAKKAVITVVPYMQQLHGISETVGDYWRFTPLTLKRLYEENGLTLRYCSADGDASSASIYIFCIGYRGELYDSEVPFRFDIKIEENSKFSPTNVIGANIIR